MHGALSTMPAEDLLEWAARRKLSAPLTFERENVMRSLVVEDGVIVWASSNRREEQLGVILARSGFVAERALAEALEARVETGVPLGKMLLMSGLIGEVDLVDILATKIRETVTDIVTWTEGTFEVMDRSQSQATGVNAQLSIEICLTVARRRTARMTQIMNLLGSDDAVFFVPPDAVPPAPDAMQLIDRSRLWALAGDRRSAGELAATFRGERFATFDALASMIESGRLQVDRRHRERTNSAVELAAGARSRLRQGDRAGALAMATQALHQDPSDADVRRTFSQIERARVAEIAKQLLSRHRVPRLVRELSPELAEELSLSEAEIEIAARVDGRWDLLSLLRSATVREAEALLALARLAEVGVVGARRDRMTTGTVAPSAIDRARLLPRSGIGVDGAWLVIAPPGNPIIRLDARLLDRVELIGRSPTAPLVWSGVATAGVAMAALSFIPGGPFAAAGLAYLAHERFSEARRRARSRDLLLALGDLEVALHVADGPRGRQGHRRAARAVHARRPDHPPRGLRGRQAPDARAGRRPRRGLRAPRARARPARRQRRRLPARRLPRGVGQISFRIAEVREYALRGANLPLTGGRLLQAAMGLLVVAAEERAAAGEDVALLSKRIADYEAWSGHTAGR